MGGALLAVVIIGTRKMERDPRGVQNLLEFLWDYLRDLARDQIGEKAYRDWLPFIGTLFLFIFVSNWGGALIPWKIVHLPSGELGAPFQNYRRVYETAFSFLPSFREHPC